MGIPCEKKFIRASLFVILLRVALFLNLEIYLRRLSLSFTLVVDSHALVLGVFEDDGGIEPFEEISPGSEARGISSKGGLSFGECP